MTLEEKLDETLLGRLDVNDDSIDGADCPDCEYAGEDITLQPDGLSASIKCPECGSLILNADEFTKIQRLRNA